MYKIVLNRGEVLRIADNKVVAPTSDANDPDYLEYVAWINAGNSPEEVYDDTLNDYIIPTNVFRDRFTTIELLDILRAAYNIDNSNNNVANPTLLLLVFKVQTTTTINLNSAEVKGGISDLVARGILTQERADQILIRY